MKRIALLFVSAAACAFSCGAGFLGDLEDARRQRPDLFVPEAVAEVTVDGVDGYVFNGGVVDSFRDQPAESKLARFAVLAAKRNLLKWLVKDEKTRTAELSGVTVQYEYGEQNKRCVMCFVPKTNVRFVEITSNVVNVVECKREDSSGPSCSNVVQAVVAEDGLSAYLAQVASDPTDCNSWAQIAQIYINRNSLDEAGAAYRKLTDAVGTSSILSDDDKAEWYFEAAKFEEGRGNFSAAVGYYRMVTNLAGVADVEMSSLAKRKLVELSRE